MSCPPCKYVTKLNYFYDSKTSTILKHIYRNSSFARPTQTCHAWEQNRTEALSLREPSHLTNPVFYGAPSRAEAVRQPGEAKHTAFRGRDSGVLVVRGAINWDGVPRAGWGGWARGGGAGAGARPGARLRSGPGLTSSLKVREGRACCFKHARVPRRDVRVIPPMRAWLTQRVF